MSGSVEGAGPELLFLHGLTATAASQRANAPAGYRVAAYDQRGHGSSSPVTEPSALAISEFVGDAVAVLDELGWRRAIVAGSSMGAAVALRLALDHPERVRALALVAPAFGDEPNSEIARFDAMADGIERLGIDGAIPAFRAAQLERGFPPEATLFLDDWRAHKAAPLVAALRTAGRWAPFPDLERVGSLPCPMVVVCWPDDPMHPAALAERIASLAGAPVGRLASVYEALAHPERVGEAVRPLLDAALGRLGDAGV